MGSSLKTDTKDPLQIVTSSRMVTLVPACLYNNKKKKRQKKKKNMHSPAKFLILTHADIPTDFNNTFSSHC